jgi:hypothetical protein
MDKRYTLRVGSTEGVVVAGGLVEAARTFLSTRFKPQDYGALEVRPWPMHPSRYSLALGGDRLGTLEVIRIEE